MKRGTDSMDAGVALHATNRFMSPLHVAALVYAPVARLTDYTLTGRSDCFVSHAWNWAADELH